MKKNILLFLFIQLISISLLDAALNNFCKTEANCEDINNNCQCFCAIARNSRDKVLGQDHPIFYQRHQDPFGKGCYCGARDLLILKAESKGIKHNNAVSEFKNLFPGRKETARYKQKFAK